MSSAFDPLFRDGPPEAVDLDPAMRPGVPREWNSPPSARAAKLSPQPSGGGVLKGASRPQLPPVFGTGEPPRGVSGMIRRRAFQSPDHRARHWMLLLLADRVNVWERRLRLTRLPLLAGALAVAGGSALRRSALR